MKSKKKSFRKKTVKRKSFRKKNVKRKSFRKKTVKRKSFRKKTVKRKRFRKKTVKRKSFRKVMKGGTKIIISKSVVSGYSKCDKTSKSSKKDVKKEEAEKKAICKDDQKEVELILKNSKEIRRCAFKYCTNLKSVKFSESLQSIGESAFEGCIGLESIDLSKCIHLNTIESGAFQKCTNLKSVKFSESLKSIGVSAFDRCIALESIDLSKCVNLNTISQQTFNKCTSLESIDLSNCINLNTISGKLTFGNCKNLKSVDLSKCTKLTTLTSSAFYNCTSLSSVKFSESLESIGETVFLYCTALVSVTFPKSLESIGKAAFEGCIALNEIDLSKCTKLTTISQQTFNKCNSLESIDLSNCINLNTISKVAFYNCTSLSSVKFSESLKSIEESAFEDCTALVSVTFPKSLEIIGVSAFDRCIALESIDLSKCINLNTISQQTFNKCNSLESVKFLYIHSKVYQNNSFLRCFKLCKTLLFPEKIVYIDLNKTSININKKIILVGEAHSPPVDSINYQNQEIPSFILELLDRLKVDNKKLDIFLEMPYIMKSRNPRNPPNPSKGGGGKSTIFKVNDFLEDCIKGKCKIEGKIYENCRLHYIDIRNEYDIYYDLEQPLSYLTKNNWRDNMDKWKSIYKKIKINYYIKITNEFLGNIKERLKQPYTTYSDNVQIIDYHNFKKHTEIKTLDNDNKIKILHIVNYRILDLIKTIKNIFEKRKSRKGYVSDIITTEKIIHFCLYFEYYEDLTIISLCARIMDIYNLIRMFQIFEEPDGKTSNSEYIITYHGNAHTVTYYYFLLFIQLSKEKQQSLIDKNEIIKITHISDISDKMNITNTQKFVKFVKIEDVIRNKGEDSPFETYGHLIDDFVEDFPIKVS